MDLYKGIPAWVTSGSLQTWLLQKEQLSAKLAILEQLAGPHIAWYTHKNPFSCWICDYIILSRRLLELLDREVINTAESHLDSMTEFSSQGVEESRDAV